MKTLEEIKKLIPDRIILEEGPDGMLWPTNADPKYVFVEEW